METATVGRSDRVELVRSLRRVLSTEERLRQARRRVMQACREAGIVVTGQDAVRKSLCTAVAQRGTVCISYIRPCGETSVRNIEPMHLEDPLCEAYCHLRQEFRRFHVGRVEWLVPFELLAEDDPCTTGV